MTSVGRSIHKEQDIDCEGEGEGEVVTLLLRIFGDSKMPAVLISLLCWSLYLL